MAGDEVYARLRKDTKRLLCGCLVQGRPTCRGVVAWVYGRTTDFKQFLAQEDPDALDFGGVVLCTPLGFSLGNDGIWSLCNYSTKYWNHQRRSLSMAGQGQGQRPRSRLPVPKYRRGNLDTQDGWQFPVPCRVRCPECQQVQLITPEVEAAATDAWAQRERDGAAPWRARYVEWQKQHPDAWPRTWGAYQEWLDRCAYEKQQRLVEATGCCVRRIHVLFKAGALDAKRSLSWLSCLGNIRSSPLCTAPIQAGLRYAVEVPGDAPSLPNGVPMTIIYCRGAGEWDAMDQATDARLTEVDNLLALLHETVLPS